MQLNAILIWKKKTQIRKKINYKFNKLFRIVKELKLTLKEEAFYKINLKALAFSPISNKVGSDNNEEN